MIIGSLMMALMGLVASENVIATFQVSFQQQNGETQQASVQVYEGEDAAVAAFRYAEDHGLVRDNDVGAGYIYTIAKDLNKQLLEVEAFEGPPDFHLKTVGKYIRRATEVSKDGFYDEAGHDIVRAMLRKGIDENTREQLKVHLVKALRDLPLQRRREAKEREEEAKAVARQKAEEEALEDAKRRQEADDEDWRRFADERFGDRDHVEKEVLLSATINLQKGEDVTPAIVQLGHNQKIEEAVVQFCSINDVSEVEEVHTVLSKHVEEKGGSHQPSALEGVEKHQAKGTKLMNKAAFLDAGVELLKALLALPPNTPSDDPLRTELKTLLDSSLALHRRVTAFETDYRNGKWAEALVHLATVQQSSRNKGLLLMKSRCYQQLGKWPACIREAGYLIQYSADHTSWKRGQPRMMAVQLGAQGAMEMGNIEKALKFFKSVLKFDPEQREIRSQYKALKGIGKQLQAVDNHLEHGRNHKSIELLEDILASLRGMKVNSVLFRSGILLKLCRAQSGKQLHEQALVSCNQAFKQRVNPMDGLFADTAGLAEALETRALAHENDNNHDEAVSDRREAVELLNGERREGAEQKLREAQHKKRMWSENRDHALVLKLPVNLNELSHDKKCHWVKRQYKLLAKKWHPDRAKGNKVRAERKMREVADAKQQLYEDYACKGK